MADDVVLHAFTAQKLQDPLNGGSGVYKAEMCAVVGHQVLVLKDRSWRKRKGIYRRRGAANIANRNCFVVRYGPGDDSKGRRTATTHISQKDGRGEVRGNSPEKIRVVEPGTGAVSEWPGLQLARPHELLAWNAHGRNFTKDGGYRRRMGRHGAGGDHKNKDKHSQLETAEHVLNTQAGTPERNSGALRPKNDQEVGTLGRKRG